MEKIPEKKELSVNLPASYIQQIYNILLVANNRATWHPDELIPVGIAIKELKTILEKIEKESSNEEDDEKPKEDDEKPKEE
tara:strand:- start:628 stop:870 length:243 start_codon:yes stop_codon:yes gene_type:complete